MRILGNNEAKAGLRDGCTSLDREWAITGVYMPPPILVMTTREKAGRAFEHDDKADESQNAKLPGEHRVG